MTHLSRNYDHNAKDFMFHRDQRSANIEHLEWDWRMQPIHGWGKDVLAAVCTVVTIICIFGIAWVLK